MGVACGTRGGRRNAHRVYVKKCGGKRRMGRTVQRWEDNIDITSKHIWKNGVEWINMAHEMGQ
jgi:hypothetical protein